MIGLKLLLCIQNDIFLSFYSLLFLVYNLLPYLYTHLFTHQDICSFLPWNSSLCGFIWTLRFVCLFWCIWFHFCLIFRSFSAHHLSKFVICSISYCWFSVITTMSSANAKHGISCLNFWLVGRCINWRELDWVTLLVVLRC